MKRSTFENHGHGLMYKLGERDWFDFMWCSVTSMKSFPCIS